jgi:hypothetical protein
LKLPVSAIGALPYPLAKFGSPSSIEQKMNNFKPAVQWLFLDLNAFFASCEQQEAPALRGKPVIVVQTPTDSAVV